MRKVKAERGRFSSSKKMEAVSRVLRGEDLDVVSREVSLTAAQLSAWRDQFLAGGRASLKSRVADGRDEELARLKILVGGLTMRKEVLREGLRRAKEALPFGPAEVGVLSHTVSPFANCPYGVVLVAQEWSVPRSTFYHQRRRADGPPCEPVTRGPKTSYTDEALTDHSRQVLAASPFLGEGHRKVWARLRVQGIRTSKARVLCLMRQAGLLAPSRAQRVVGPQVHDGTIITDRPNQM